MAHSLTTIPAPAIPISTKSKNTPSYYVLPSLKLWASTSDFKTLSNVNFVNRRRVSLGLIGALLGLNVGGGCQNSKAAARRPPPPPPEEKKDPNVSGVQAKVLASRKRKEAMKASIAKLKEKGNPINQESKSAESQ